MDSEAARTRRGIVLCLLAMLLFAGQDAVTKVLAQRFDVAQFVMVRYLAFAAFALAFAARRVGLGAAARSRRPWLQVGRSLLAVGEIAIFAVALRYLGLAEIHALFATFPLLTLALAGPLLGERVGWRRWLAVVAGFGGTLLMVRPGGELFGVGALIALGAALAFAVYNLVTRLASRSDGFETSILYMAVVGAVAATLFGIPVWRSPNGEEWLLLGLLSASSIAAHMLLIRALEYAQASTLQPFNYTLLVYATALGFLVFGELPDPWTVVGALVVVCSGLYAINVGGLRRARSVGGSEA